MQLDLVIHNGIVVIPTGRFPANIAIFQGKIQSINHPDLPLPQAAEYVDAEGQYVLPGLIDPDVNFRDPGLEYKEKWETGSESAVCGGFTTVFVMPNGGKPIVDVEALQDQLDRAENNSYCNFGIKASVVPQNLGKLADLADAGVIGFRFSMGAKHGVIDPLSDFQMLEAFHEVGQLGLTCGVHAENRDITSGLTRQAIDDGKHVKDLNEVRPPFAEQEALNRAVILAEQSDVKLAIYHVSTREALTDATRHKEHMKDRLFLQTNPHYVVMSAEEMVPRCGPALAMFPPVRAQSHQIECLTALGDGRIDVIGSDHSPHKPNEKNYGKFDESAAETTPGWPGVETSAAVMLSAVNAGAMTLERFVEVQSANPAKIWGIYPDKGAIQVGSDADFTIVNMNYQGEVDETKLKTLHKKTNWHGWPLTAMPVVTIVGGVVVAKDGHLVTDKTPGTYTVPQR